MTFVSPTSNVALVAYVASPHAGYLRMFRKHRSAVPYVLGEEFVAEFLPLTRNLPAVHPSEARKMINALGIFVVDEEHGPTTPARILNPTNVAEVRAFRSIVMPDEDVSHAMAERYFAGCNVSFEDWRLRWDWKETTAHRRPEVETTVSFDEFDRSLMRSAERAAQKSPDWWRQIGAALVRDGKVILSACNTHMPSEQSGYLKGDPRSNFGPGEHIDASLAAHAETTIIAEAARLGIQTEGCDMYVTTFPCPPCANYVALAGIRRLFYLVGYSRVEGAAALTSRGVEIVRVEMNTPPVS